MLLLDVWKIYLPKKSCPKVPWLLAPSRLFLEGIRNVVDSVGADPAPFLA